MYIRKYIISGLLVLALVLPIAVKAQDNTNADEAIMALLQKIEQLKQQIADLQTQLTQVDQRVQEIIKFTKTLRKGMADEEVKGLQEFLKEDPEVYPEGLVTGYFGDLTEKAVKKFQEKHADNVLKPLGLSEGTGIVGPKTIEIMNNALEEAGKSGKVPSGLLRTAEVSPASEEGVEEKITICHILPGNPENKQTITIAKSALEAHLAHGDTLGACIVPTPCSESWSCGEWSACENNIQTRICTDANNCGTVNTRPGLSQNCTPVPTPTPTPCSESWSCGEWSACENNMQTRICTDSNGCGTTNLKPALSQACIPIPTPIPTATSSIRVIFPNGGEILEKGSNYDIQWYATSDVTQVRIELLKNGVLVSSGVIANLVSDAGSYTWIVSRSLLDGDDYTIRITKSGSVISDTSDLPFIIRQSPPDLTIDKISLTNNYTNTSNQISALIHNIGDQMASHGFIARFYVDGVFLYDYIFGVDMMADVMWHASASHIFTSAGPHTIKVIIDATNIISESNENNNELVYTTNVTVPPEPKPDLTITSISVTNNYTDALNKISAMVKNIGNAIAPKNFIVKFYVDGIFLSDYTFSVDMTANVMWSASVPYTFSSAGPHIIKAVVDATNVVQESNENNNELVYTADITAPPEPLPDLTIAMIHLTNNYANTPNRIGAMVKNAGTQTAPAGFVVRFYVDGEFVYDYTFNSDMMVNYLWNAYAPYIFSSAGPHTVKAVVEATNIMEESNENNNEIIYVANIQ